MTGAFDHAAHTSHDARRRLWNRDSFAFDPDVTGTRGTRAQLVLVAPILIDVPLATIRKGDVFSVTAVTSAGTLNMRQRESYLSAFFRDPQQASRVSLRS